MTKDLTKSVMEKVVAVEKRRSFWWLGKFMLAASGLLLVAGTAIWTSVWQIQQQGTWDLLSLSQEDGEIIRQYWQDTVGIFWEELPKEQLIVAVLALGLIGVFLFTRRKSLSVVRKKLQQIRTYQE